MPFVEAKCTNCGAVLPVDNTRDVWVCGYCGTPFVVEKAIQQFNVTNNITADTVVVLGGKEDFEIRGGVLLKYHGSAREVTVPEGVVEIGETAFQDCKNLCRAVISEGVERIGLRAFMNCSKLQEVIFPRSLHGRIAGDAFEGSDIKRSTTYEPYFRLIKRWKPANDGYGYPSHEFYHETVDMPPDLTQEEAKRWIYSNDSQIREDTPVRDFVCYYCGGKKYSYLKSKCKSCGRKILTRVLEGD